MSYQDINPMNVTEQQPLSELENSAYEAALKCLEALSGTVVVGHILAPLDKEWTGDAGNL